MYKASTGGAPSGDQLKQRRVSSTDGAVSGGQSSSKSVTAKRVIGASMTDFTQTSAASSGTAVTHALTNGSGIISGDGTVVLIPNGHHQRCGKKATGKKNTTAVHHRKHIHGNRLPTTTMTLANGTGNGCVDSDSTTSSSDAITMAASVRNGDADQNNNSLNVIPDQTGQRRSNIDELLKVYFPVTLQVAVDATDSNRRRPSDASIVDGTWGRRSGHRLHNPSRSGSTTRRIRSAGSRQSSTRSSSSSTSNGSFDRIYLAAMDDAHLGNFYTHARMYTCTHTRTQYDNQCFVKFTHNCDPRWTICETKLLNNFPI